jgi:hypothetical protein
MSIYFRLTRRLHRSASRPRADFDPPEYAMLTENHVVINGDLCRWHVRLAVNKKDLFIA